MEEMRLVIVTGAGASCELGRDGERLPLMPEWSDHLCEALDAEGDRLARGAGLERGMSGPDFEKAIGLLLEWRGIRWLAERFEPLGGNNPGEVFAPVQQARLNTEKWLNVIVRVINTTLYDLFGNDQLDQENVRGAYDRMLREWLDKPKSLVLATTNYDHSAETALNALNYGPDLGFRGPYTSTQRLQPEGIVDWTPENGGAPHHGRTPVFHLHGAVGWYRRGDEVLDYHGDDRFNESLGTPAVLYPDPGKDPVRDPSVAALWAEFEKALEGASHVLVIGHSLNDEALTTALRKKGNRVAVIVYEDAVGEFENPLADAALFFGAFGLQPRIADMKGFQAWRQKS